jgi:hypothetical protein
MMAVNETTEMAFGNNKREIVEETMVVLARAPTTSARQTFLKSFWTQQHEVN